MSVYLIDPLNAAQYPQEQVGGKARSLLQLASQGLPVPKFVCLSIAAYELCTQPQADAIEGLLEQLWTLEPREINTLAEQLQSLVRQCSLAPELQAQLNGWAGAGSRFSVRSSGAAEDGRQHSFAGQFLSRLNVPATGLSQAVLDCWASGFDTGVLAYVRKKNLRDYSNRMAVVIQHMVVAESAGVLFQVDPQGDHQRQIIVAGFGLGEGIVADRVETDHYVYHRRTQAWELQIAHKTRRIACRDHDGVSSMALAPELGDRAVLSDPQRRELLTLSAKISSLYTDAQDIEWAFDAAGKLHLLQSRPITTRATGSERIFDNSNIAESYPGVISPMTFSIVQRDYYYCVKDLLRRCGTPAALREKYEDVLQHLVGYIDGRAYYNMGNWYRVLLLAPYFKKRLVNYFEQMIGSESALRPGLDNPDIRLRDKLHITCVFPVKFVCNLLFHKRLMRRYFTAAASLQQHTENLPYDTLCTEELISQLHYHVRHFMPLMSIPLLNDFFAMIFMALTREQFVNFRDRANHRAEADESLLNRLLGNQNIASAAPVASLAALAEQVRNDRDLRLILEKIPQQTHDFSALLEQSSFTEFAHAWREHLAAFGYRAPKELIMEVDTFAENPHQLLALVLKTAQRPARGAVEKGDPEQELTLHLKQVKHPRLLRWLLRKTRQTIAHREATRLDRGRHFGLLRRLLRLIGKRLVGEGVLQHSDQIFMLTLTELDEYRQGTSPNANLRNLVEFRREQMSTWREQGSASRVVTCGLAGAGRSPQYQATHSGPETLTNLLAGKGVSGGLVTAPARVVVDPNQAGDIEGSILISESTDPGWVFLMTLASGLVCERGSLLSHTAIIGRELGIPTIVGVKDATHHIRDGQMITMNGDTGEIRCHTEACNSPADSMWPSAGSKKNA